MSNFVCTGRVEITGASKAVSSVALFTSCVTSSVTYPLPLMVGRTMRVVPTSLYCTTWSRCGVLVGSERESCTNGRCGPTLIAARSLFAASSTGRLMMTASPLAADARRVAVTSAPPTAP